MQALTERQQAVLQFIVRHIQQNQFPPTVREIGLALGIRSTNGVSDHLKALERKGYLERRGMKSRGLVPTPGALEVLGIPVEADETSMASTSWGDPAGVVRVPLLGKVAAGQPILAEESWEDTLQIDRDLLGKQPDAVTFALRVQGDSMIGDGIFEGDVVLVRKQATARQGEIVVARIENEATVKRFFQENGGIRLEPSNPRLSPLIVRGEDARDVQILGVVVALFRNLDGGA
jgi:repressor LexA